MAVDTIIRDDQLTQHPACYRETVSIGGCAEIRLTATTSLAEYPAAAVLRIPSNQLDVIAFSRFVLSTVRGPCLDRLVYMYSGRNIQLVQGRGLVLVTVLYIQYYDRPCYLMAKQPSRCGNAMGKTCHAIRAVSECMSPSKQLRPPDQTTLVPASKGSRPRPVLRRPQKVCGCSS